MRKTVVLAILDGWGIGNPDEGNAIYTAHPRSIEEVQATYPVGALQASGQAVGLPWQEEGNSEVGHLTLGAGRMLLQHFPEITAAIDNGSFFTNKAFVAAFAHARKHSSAVHLVGLLSSGNVHASREHLIALIEMARREQCTKLFLHLFLDGRDSGPRSSREDMEKVYAALSEKGVGTLASVSGRYYGMDRDRHWDRTERAYRVLVGDSMETKSFESAVTEAYERDLSDEYVEPTVIDAPHPIRDNDAIIFFNFREDRMRQLVRTFTDVDFVAFPTKKFTNVFIATMTAYQTTLPVTVAFETIVVPEPLGKVLADNGKTQLRVAETEKYAHVTYFFNGLVEAPFENEFRVLVPSQRLARHDAHPEMMASAITDRVLVALNDGGFDFILVNYANPDIIAHSGNYDATIAAIEVIDREIGRLTQKVIEGGHVLFITSDHGNAEVVLDVATGLAETKHDANPVPLHLVGRGYERRTRREGFFKPPEIGMLSDVAPTILELMGLPKPATMTGESLLDQLTLQMNE
jgi:2,3-bisphosphoglycerate-independent phosphoglycerate mutase